METKLKKLSYWTSIAALGIILGISLQFVKAWSEPTAVPPAGNVGAPINTSATGQTKLGGLILNSSATPAANGLIVRNGDVLIGAATKSAGASSKTGVIDVKDAWIRDANGGAGAWASAAGGGAPVASGLYGSCSVSRSNDTNCTTGGNCSAAAAPAFCSNSVTCSCQGGYKRVITGRYHDYGDQGSWSPASCAIYYSCVKN